ncbi:GlxA family transcriptional regulator [Sulfitobacter geojensis]|uniref:GlxA family transcriptional regulator n=1 Tax=Sulfitobacter geojensis TaxID=1342299 RepID=UPI003B8B4DC2
MDTPVTARNIDVLLYENMNLLDVAGPVQTFKTARVNTRLKYKMRYVSLDGKPVRSCCGLTLEAEAQLDDASPSNDLLIPGGIGVDALVPDQRLRRIVQQRAAHKGDGRLISVCSGALVLAAAGVLDGLAATTHWSRAADVRKFADVLWDLDRICTTHRRVFTSAGVVTGIDLALAIIRADCGAAAALDVARELVVQLRRTGGQSQYALHLAGQFSADDALARLIEQVVTHPHLEWSLEMLADTAGMNARTLSRHFKRDLQVTPAQFVERVRVDHARGLLQGKLPLKQVAQDSGFGDLQRMQRAFQRRFGVRVSEYLTTFGDV